jgi:hypothetical protein
MEEEGNIPRGPPMPFHFLNSTLLSNSSLKKIRRNMRRE